MAVCKLKMGVVSAPLTSPPPPSSSLVTLSDCSRSVIHLANTQSEAAQQLGAAGMASGAGDGVLPADASTLGSGGDGMGSETLADADALLLCYGVGEVQKCTTRCQETVVCCRHRTHPTYHMPYPCLLISSALL